MIKSAYGFIGNEQIEDIKILLAGEINIFLDKIHRKIGKKKKLDKLVINPIDFQMIKAGAVTKAWEFGLNNFDQVINGHIGKIKVITNGLDIPIIRKQRALLIAAELFVYYSFANANPRKYNSIKNQNQYLDFLRKIIGGRASSEIRDYAIRYVIEEIEFHALAQHSGHFWYTRLNKIEKHMPDIAHILGSSEKTCRNIKKNQNVLYTTKMLKEEDILIRLEIEDIEYIESVLDRLNKQKQFRKAIIVHKKNIELFKKELKNILNKVDDWVVQKKPEHKKIRKKQHRLNEQLAIIKKESNSDMPDINKVHAILEHFEKEKINILRDIGILSV